MSCRAACLKRFDAYARSRIRTAAMHQHRVLTLSCRLDDQRKTRVLRVDHLGVASSGERWFKVSLSGARIPAELLFRLQDTYDLVGRQDPHIVGGKQIKPAGRPAKSMFYISLKRRVPGRGSGSNTMIPLTDIVSRYTRVGSRTIADADLQVELPSAEATEALVRDLAPLFVKQCRRFSDRDGHVVVLG